MREAQVQNPEFPTLETCNFEALEVTAMYFTFSETSSLCLFGQERSRAAFLVHDILSGIYLGLLHKVKNVYKHSKETVYGLSMSLL